MKMQPPLQFMFMLPESRATSYIFIRPPRLQVGGVFVVDGVVTGLLVGGVVAGVGVVGGAVVVGGVVVVGGGGVVTGVGVVGGVVVVVDVVSVVGVVGGVVNMSHLGFRVIVPSVPQSQE